MRSRPSVESHVSIRLLLTTVALALGAAAHAAPAPLPRQERHPPSPDTLFANFKAEGYSHLCRLERVSGNVYVVEVHRPIDVEFESLRVIPTSFTVETRGRNVREELREFLEQTRKTLEEAYRRQR